MWSPCFTYIFWCVWIYLYSSSMRKSDIFHTMIKNDKSSSTVLYIAGHHTSVISSTHFWSFLPHHTNSNILVVNQGAFESLNTTFNKTNVLVHESFLVRDSSELNRGLLRRQYGWRIDAKICCFNKGRPTLTHSVVNTQPTNRTWLRTSCPCRFLL